MSLDQKGLFTFAVMNWQMTEVRTANHIRRFLDFPATIYTNDSKWIRPLNKDIEAVFNPQKNKLFRKGGICKRWLLENPNGETLGRIAAFINPKYKQEQPTGGIGFFEVLENEQAAFFMLDYCKAWLKEQEMEAMDGPINFGERDRFWGLVIEGYFEPLYGMNYNPPYYKRFFENYGFNIYFYQECYGMDVSYDFQKKFHEKHDSLQKNTNLHVRHLIKKDWKKYALDFAKIYNKAWITHGEGKNMEQRQAIQIFKAMRPAMDESINWFVYDGEEPIACWINLPDLNQYFKYFKGKFGFFQKLYFLWLKNLKANTKIVGIVFGIIPQWQGKGVDAYMILEGTQYLIKHSNYKDYEMQWIGDFNPKMLNVAQSLGGTITRRLATYRYLFDRSKSFIRHPIL